MVDVVKTFSGTGSLDSTWTIIEGSADVSSNNWRGNSTSFAYDTTYEDTNPTSGTFQYGKIIAATNDFYYPYIVFRLTNGASPFYYLQLDGNTGTVEWYHASAAGGTKTSLDTGAVPGSYISGNSFAAVMDGSGGSILVRVWKNPTGDAPDPLGLTWGGASPNDTLNIGGGAQINSGNFMGIGDQSGSPNQILISRFTYGDVSAAPPPPPPNSPVIWF